MLQGTINDQSQNVAFNHWNSDQILQLQEKQNCPNWANKGLVLVGHCCCCFFNTAVVTIENLDS